MLIDNRTPEIIFKRDINDPAIIYAYDQSRVMWLSVSENLYIFTSPQKNIAQPQYLSFQNGPSNKYPATCISDGIITNIYIKIESLTCSSYQIHIMKNSNLFYEMNFTTEQTFKENHLNLLYSEFDDISILISQISGGIIIRPRIQFITCRRI